MSVDCPACGSLDVKALTETDFTCLWCGHEWVEPADDGCESSPCEDPWDRREENEDETVVRSRQENET